MQMLTCTRNDRLFSVRSVKCVRKIWNLPDIIHRRLLPSLDMCRNFIKNIWMRRMQNTGGSKGRIKCLPKFYDTMALPTWPAEVHWEKIPQKVFCFLAIFAKRTYLTGPSGKLGQKNHPLIVWGIMIFCRSGLMYYMSPDRHILSAKTREP